MFAQLTDSRRTRPRSPAGFAASLALHGILVAGAVLLTSRVPTRHAVRSEATVRFLRPAPARPPVATTRASAPQPASPGTMSVINVPILIPDGIPPMDPLRAVINFDQPFEFRVGAQTRAGTTTDVNVEPGSAMLADQVEVQVVLDPRSPMPRYPQLLKDAGVEGAVRVRFVVDTLGRAELASVQVLESSHAAFTVAVQAALPRMRFAPARVGQRPVRQLVEFPLQFQLTR